MSHTYTPNNQVPSAEYTLPDDGDPAIVASVDTAFQALANNVAFLFLMSQASANVANYGADPTGVSDSKAAFDLAIAALPSGGGVVIVPPGTYLLSAGFFLTRGISFVGAPGAVLKLTADGVFFRWTGAQDGSFVTIANLELDATVAVSTIVIADGAGAHVLLQNLRIGTSNSALLRNSLVYCDGPSTFDIVDCELVKGPEAANAVVCNPGSTIRTIRTKIRAVPGQSWVNAFVYYAATSLGGMWDSTIDFSGNGTGLASPVGVDVRSDGLTFSDITFTNSSGANGNDRAWSWPAGTNVVIGPCNYFLVANPWGFRNGGEPVLPAAGRSSVITWRGQYRHGPAGAISSSTFNCYDGYDQYVIEDSSSSNPTIYLPTPQPGKTCTVLLINNHAGGYAGPSYDDDGTVVYTGSAMSEGQNQLTTWMPAEVVVGNWFWVLVTERTY